MKLLGPVPKPPAFTLSAVLWAVAIGGAIYVATCLLYLLAPPLALLPTVLLACAALYLIVGEMIWGVRGDE